jgi:hypothetical protein
LRTTITVLPRAKQTDATAQTEEEEETGAEAEIQRGSADADGAISIRYLINYEARYLDCISNGVRQAEAAHALREEGANLSRQLLALEHSARYDSAL